MSRKIYFFLFLLAILCSPVVGKTKKRPNIILILADDMGYSDLGCYGSEIRTPNLDALAKSGLRFTNFYNAGRCCPTRASLMTGVYPHQTGIGRMTFNLGLPGYTGQLGRNVVTIGEVLQMSGYHTAMVGKWHLSETKEGPDHFSYLNNQKILDKFADLNSYPVNRGFDEFYGIIWGVADYFDPFTLVHNETPVKSVPKNFYLTDAITDHAVEYIDKYTKDDEPLFMYVAYTSPHWPVMARPEEIKEYADSYKPGWDKIRNARYEKMKRLGVFKGGTTHLSERFAPDLEWSAQIDKEYRAGAMAAHAAMITDMDKGIGKIVAELKAKGEFDNTLVMFMSDNGASPESVKMPGFDRPSETRDGRKVAYYDEMVEKRILPGAETTSGSIGNMWANVANAPFRFWKAEMFEGGIATPLICSFPKRMKAKPGSITDQAGNVTDVMATILDLTGARYPSEYKGNKILGLEGLSLLPILEGKARQPHDAMYWEHFNSRAIRMGNWKLVSRPNSDWELYDLSVDRTETNNVASSNPERVKMMARAWDVWAHRANVYPMPPSDDSLREIKKGDEIED